MISAMTTSESLEDRPPPQLPPKRRNSSREGQRHSHPHTNGGGVSAATAAELMGGGGGGLVPSEGEAWHPIPPRRERKSDRASRGAASPHQPASPSPRKDHAASSSSSVAASLSAANGLPPTP